MKEIEKNIKPSGGAKRKGFYIAVYGSVGLMLMIAAVIGFRNLQGVKQNDTALVTPPAWEDSLAADVNASKDDYLAPEDRDSSSIIDPWLEAENPDRHDDYSGADSTIIEPDDPETDLSWRQKPAASATPSAKPEDAAKESDEPEQDPVSEPSTDIEPAEEGFTAFDDTMKMQWPVFGEVVMDYSMDHLVYDKTLEQYRTNSNLCIAAEAGEQVRASADGIVKDVFTSRENGKSVTIDHGNGWSTTYSQLQDNVLVNIGDVVKGGQVIGGVGDPSIYSLLLGNHLAFSVSNDQGYINPNEILNNN